MTWLTALSVIVTIITLAVVYFLLYPYFKPHTDTAAGKPDYVISPSALLSEYETDEAKADIKYLDKIIEIEGIIKKVTTLDNGSAITIDTGDDMSAITCEFESVAAVASLKEGARVKVRGLCTGKLMDIVLARCTVM